MIEIETTTLTEAIQGDQGSFRKVYDFYKEFVWKVVYRTVNGNEELSKTIVQNIFVQLFKVLNTFQFKSSFSTWLYRITYNETMAVLRLEQRNNTRHEALDNNILQQEKGATIEEKDIVKKILNTLSPEDRFLLVSREVNGFTFDELAETTGKKSGALRTTMSRIKEQIRQRFSYEYQE